ncbi:MAG TPA: alpha/beta hydrolase [Solirubrobacteraceae bacterium]|nr:alpha/beta hydrolase [Solirubrobacteraceae bacterium]
MELTPRLIEVSATSAPAAVVLVLHGGASRRRTMQVSPTQLSVLRMVPIAARIARAGRGRLAVFRLLNTHRGWDASHTPVQDAHWALNRIGERLGELPACLVGHSLGGRAALLASDRPEVRSTVALAPWVYPYDAVTGIAGKHILFVHGSDDRVASPERSAIVAQRLAREAEVNYVDVVGGNHAMLGRHEVFDGLAAEFATATLLGESNGGTVARLQNGERWIEV